MSNCLKILLAVLLLCGMGFAQGSQFPLTPILDQYGNAQAGAQIYVCTAGTPITSVPCGSEVTVYQDYTLSHAITQPVVSDGTGNFTFGCNPGVLQIQVVLKTTNYSYIGACPAITQGGMGTITGVTAAAGSGLTGGGTSGTLNLGLITSCSSSQVLVWTSGTPGFWGCGNNGTGTITGATASGGLVATETTLGLITSCSDGQTLAWSLGSSSWGCAAAGGSGTVTSVATTYPITGGTFTTSGTIALTNCSNNTQILQYASSAWTCVYPSWNILTSQLSNLSLSLQNAGTAYTSTFIEGDFGASPAATGAWLITDNSTSSTDTSPTLAINTGNNSYHTPFEVSLTTGSSSFPQFTVCNVGGSHLGFIAVGNIITCPNLSISPASKVWIMDASNGHTQLTLYMNGTSATNPMLRFHTATAAASAPDFFLACTSATPNSDGTCSSGGNVAALTGLGGFQGSNFSDLTGSTITMNGVTITGAPTRAGQCPTSTSTSAGTWQDCFGGGTAAKCAASGTAAATSVVSCGASVSGSFSCDPAAASGTGNGLCQINTTAMISSANVVLINPSSAEGTTSPAGSLSVVCNTASDTSLTKPRLLSKTSGNFIINLGTYTGNPECFNFTIQ